MTTASTTVESTSTNAAGKTEKVKRTFLRSADSPFSQRQICEAKAPLALAGTALMAVGAGATILVQRYVLPRLAGLNNGS